MLFRLADISKELNKINTEYYYICIAYGINPRLLYYPKGHRPARLYRLRNDTTCDTDFDMSCSFYLIF